MSPTERYIKLAEADPQFIKRRRLLTLAFGLRTFFASVEYSIILPSVLLYVQRFKVQTVINGFVIAAYPLGGMISPPIFGRLYDRTRKIRQLFFLLNTLQIIGNVVYATPLSAWMLLTGRFICGLGDGAVACVTGEVMRVYPKSARTGIISLIEMGRVPGLVIGPAFNFFIGKMSYEVFNWRLDFTTLPGVVMALGWMLMQFLTMCLVSNLSLDMMNKHDKLPTDGDAAGSETTFISERQSDDEEEACEDNTSLIGEKKESDDSERNERKMKISFYSDMIQNCSIELVLLGLVDSVLWTVQTVFEIIIPYITEFEYGWEPVFVGIIYAIGAVLLILVFLMLYCLGKYYTVRETYLLVFSLVLASAALALLIVERILKVRLHRIITCGAMCFLIFTAAPINLVASKSLITKITTPEIQGLIQGLYNSVTKVSMIIGPIIGSLVFHQRKFYAVSAIGVVMLSLIGMVMCLKAFHEKEDILSEMYDEEE